MKKIVFLNVFLFIASVLYGQAYFIEGYIIDNTGERIQGLIHDLDWVYNPDYIEFKKDSAAEVEKLYASDIKAFRTDYNYYFSYHGIVDRSPVNEKDLKINTLKVRDTIVTFLKVLNKGRISLYEYHNREPDKYIFFIKSTYGKITELVYQKTMIKKGNGYLIKVNDQYIEQLKVYLSDIYDLRANILSVKYNRNSLSRIISKYNGYFGSGRDAYSLLKKKTKKRFTYYSGFSYITSEYNSNQYFFIKEKRHSSLNYLPAVGFEYFFPSAPNKLAYYLNIGYNIGNYRHTEEDEEYAVEYNLKADHCKASTGFKFYFTESKVRPFIHLGTFIYDKPIYLSYSNILKADLLVYFYDNDYYFPWNLRAGLGVELFDRINVDLFTDKYFDTKDELYYFNFNVLIGYHINFYTTKK
jgi:hypothetical protein